MTVIEVAPLFLTEVDLRLGVDNYEKHVSGVTFTPTVPGSVSWTGLGGNTHSNTGAGVTWAYTFDYVQDWDTEDSLSQYMKDNAGTTVSAVFTPLDSAPWYADIVIVPGPIGGTGQAYATGSVTAASTEPSRTAPVI